MKTKALNFIAQSIVDMRKKAQALEAECMRFDCSWTDTAAEDEYVELTSTVSELELLCCRSFEDAEYLSAQVAARMTTEDLCRDLSAPLRIVPPGRWSC